MINFKKRINSIENFVRKHDELADTSISLITSGNVVSKRVLKLMSTDLMYRAAEGKSGNQFFPGLDYFYKIEDMAEKDLAEIFRADFSDLRPLSGSQANMIVYTALAEVGDTIIVPTISSGSHVSTAGKVVQKLRNFNFIRTKSQDRSLLIDMLDLAEKIKLHKPKIVVLGGSLVNEWQDFRKISDLIHKNNGILVYDASHVAGLMAQGEFPNPMDFGADIMTMTTCKTIPGPSHAWIFGKSMYKEQIEKTIFPGFVSGGHLQEYVGAIVSLYEIMLPNSSYSKKIIQYSQLLGGILEKNGFKIIKTSNNKITETHQIVIERHEKIEVKEIEERLAKIGIFVNINYLPDCGFDLPVGLRIGTQEIVRLGAGKKHVEQIASIIISCVNEKKPNFKDYRLKVAKLRKSFNNLK